MSDKKLLCSNEEQVHTEVFFTLCKMSRGPNMNNVVHKELTTILQASATLKSQVNNKNNGHVQ